MHIHRVPCSTGAGGDLIRLGRNTMYGHDSICVLR